MTTDPRDRWPATPEGDLARVRAWNRGDPDAIAAAALDGADRAKLPTATEQMEQPMRKGADRIRVEVEIDGKTVAYELVAEGEKIPFDLEIESELREVPDIVPWRQWEPTGRFRIKLDAFGRKVIRTQPEV